MSNPVVALFVIFITSTALVTKEDSQEKVAIDDISNHCGQCQPNCGRKQKLFVTVTHHLNCSGRDGL